MTHAATLTRLIQDDALRMQILRAVRALAVPDCWIAAGFVRDAVWDILHGRDIGPPRGDIDVIRFDADRASTVIDRTLEKKLAQALPGLDWSVKNQARMHRRNKDAPYASATDAMRYWPESATAVAVRLDETGEIEIAAPYGLDDLFELKLRPTPLFVRQRRAIFDTRVREKDWLHSYPMLQLIGG